MPVRINNNQNIFIQLSKLLRMTDLMSVIKEKNVLDLNKFIF